MNEDFDKFEQQLHIHVYRRLVKFVAIIGFLVGMGVVFVANSAPNKPIIADVEVTVKGLVCPSCAIGLKNIFKRHILVLNVAIDTKKGLLLLDNIETDNVVRYIKNKDIIKMVEKSGYNVSSIKRLDNKKPNRYNKP